MIHWSFFIYLIIGGLIFIKLMQTREDFPEVKSLPLPLSFFIALVVAIIWPVVLIVTILTMKKNEKMRGI